MKKARKNKIEINLQWNSGKIIFLLQLGNLTPNETEGTSISDMQAVTRHAGDICFDT